MGSTHAQDHINGAAIAIATITPQYQSPSLNSWQGKQYCLDEALQIIGLLELLTAFTQAGGARLLVFEGCIQMYLALCGSRRGRGGHQRRRQFLIEPNQAHQPSPFRALTLLIANAKQRLLGKQVFSSVFG